MANLLFLVHRLPYPPNKGDKVRSYHLLKHLVARHRVFLGTFVDDSDDLRHLPTVRSLCADMHAEPLDPRWARLRSASAFMSGEPLSLPYYRSERLRQWVAGVRARHAIDATVVFSSVMAEYAAASDLPQGHPLLVDFVDVDSEKWAQYATQRRWPMSWVYAREGRCLLAYERALARRATRSFFVADKESDLFRRLAPEAAPNVLTMGNGVDADFFSPDPVRANPFAPGDLPLVFTGAMDYWPNIDAVTWFATEVLPGLRARWPALKFVVVGRSPPPSVQALASEAVQVTGTVPDVRPYLQHAQVVVAPMRLARGVQNKVLEAMAMGRPVVAAADCVAAIDARSGHNIVASSSADDYQQAVSTLLEDPARASQIGAAGRDCVLQSYSWHAHMTRIDPYLPGAAGAAA
ncbi:MAG: TIGR03087 family PEP-CTERM/XrtA system glycosyltransferase [Rhodoferax sp.]|nr:TIGR03087 family PEP-CTERM/XrtA system glycosyltransferase [Rhodoferax sp.]